MAVFRRTWLGLVAAAILAMACGSFSAAMASPAAESVKAVHGGCADHGAKGGSTMSSCTAGCLAITPMAPAVQAAAIGASTSFWSEASGLIEAGLAPEPPPPRLAQDRTGIQSNGVSS